MVEVTGTVLTQSRRETGILLKITDPKRITAYLESHGWAALLGSRTENAEVWVKHNSSVLVPSSTAFGDYTLRVHEVVRAVADVEGVSEAEVMAAFWGDETLAQHAQTVVDAIGPAVEALLNRLALLAAAGVDMRLPPRIAAAIAPDAARRTTGTPPA